MSTGSSGGDTVQRRAKRAHLSRNFSSSARAPVSRYDAYTFALRAAYLCHLLQPRAKRLQHVAAPKRPQPSRTSSSVTDLLKDFSGVRDTKSTRFPSAFMSELDKRITGVLVGKEKNPAYTDSNVKRTFAVFLNEFKKPEFRRGVEKDRRVEDLLLIFFSNATKELQKGKSPEDDSWKLMVDRHVALFVRLISSVMKDNDWSRERPDLAARLQTLESKLLVHDQDLSSATNRNDGQGGTTQEVEVPRSQKVKDMALVVTVAAIFGKSLESVQSDVDDQKDLWTEQTALKDLKMYQQNLSLNTHRTLRSEDFDTEEAFDAWKKAETPDLSQMMLAIMQSNIELAKSVPGALPKLKAAAAAGPDPASRALAESDPNNPYIVDAPVDMTSLNLNEGKHSQIVDEGEPYMFIPPDPRTYYRAVLKEAFMHDLRESAAEGSSARLFSKKTAELLNEIALRWRVPYASRMMLLLDVAKEKFTDKEIDIETLNDAFNYVKEPPADKKKPDMSQLFDRTKWLMSDYALNQQVLKSVEDTLLRDLFDEMRRCYESKPPEIGPIMVFLETQIYDDPIFSGSIDNLDRFADSLTQALEAAAREHYRAIFEREIGRNGDRVEFFHIVQFGKAVVKLLQRIQKRYRKNPKIMGIMPFRILAETILPTCANDVREQVGTMIRQTQGTDEEIPIQDGFDLYRELTTIRNVYTECLPNSALQFQVEDLLSTFVWRFIAVTEQSIVSWVEGAIKQDNFQVRTTNPDAVPTNDERHSVSAIDMFRSFNQAVGQVIALEWDNPLQYAKFMTALSKAIGIGISRYCEQLERDFIAEMDRLMPQQEAAATQSRQEKWMQMARDAVSNKDKVEPFQFLPQSLVRLNDIEFAMLQLDKLEKEMNVDACIDVIKRSEPKSGSQKKRRGEKFVFTIKIIEAEDLKPCDANGLSDPYVVLGDEFQKRLAKTRIIYANLNPRWDETVDITATGLLSVTATIWDWDSFGAHDCVGRTTIKLDPSHFSDYMPREYWLDLDTQGRLLVRITMEGEKDDIQFYFGKAFRGLKRTERDMTRKITDKLSAYIHHSLSKRALRTITKQNFAISNVSSYFSRGVSSFGTPQTPQPPSQVEVANALKPLFAYLNENFAIMQETLTSTSMITVMTRVWKEVLSTMESLLVPPLSEKPSAQTPLSQVEVDTVFRWLNMLFDFFLAADEETGVANGVPIDVLKSTKYHELQNLNFFYFEPSDVLIRTSERMATASAASAKAAADAKSSSSSNGTTATHLPTGSTSALLTAPSVARRTKSVFQSRNLGTMRKAKQDKRSAAQAEPSDDTILRILRMRPEAARYLRDRARQRERLAASAAAELIVRQSLAQQQARARQAMQQRPLRGGGAGIARRNVPGA